MATFLLGHFPHWYSVLLLFPFLSPHFLSPFPLSPLSFIPPLDFLFPHSSVATLHCLLPHHPHLPLFFHYLQGFSSFHIASVSPSASYLAAVLFGSCLFLSDRMLFLSPKLPFLQTTLPLMQHIQRACFENWVLCCSPALFAPCSWFFLNLLQIFPCLVFLLDLLLHFFFQPLH